MINSCTLSVYFTDFRCFMETKGLFWKNWAAGQCLLYGTIAAAMFSISLVSKIFQRKIVNIFLPISFNICFGCSKDPSH